MKKYMLLFVTILLMSVSVPAQENWNSFKSEMGKFSIDFSGGVSVSERITKKATTYKTTFTADSLNIMVSSSKHIKSLDGKDDLLNVSVDSFIKSIKGSFISKKHIEYDGVKGIYAVMSLQDGTVLVEYKVYNKGYYQYQLVAYAEKNLYNQKSADRYFDSFKIID
ncbi:MAG: hypothetical protein COA67_12580 [Lutibacter sp.]|nr:MAG: hypothetical protein COA67_12580 [Lutibacter sp.]